MVLAATGCASIGPATVQHDRVDYISAIAESWKEQTLLNVVRLRYGDAPSFADVSSVISGYTFQGGLSAGAGISSNLTATIPSNLVTVNGNATYIDRPTITTRRWPETSLPEAYSGHCHPTRSSSWSRQVILPTTYCC